MQANCDKRYGIIKYDNKFYKSCAIFEENDFYNSDELEILTKNVKYPERKIKNFFVSNENVDYNNIEQEYSRIQRIITNQPIDEEKIHKYRYYLKIVKRNCDINIKSNLLTFILFNSSYANQFKIDPTIQNCAYLTYKKYNKYSGFEIFNLFSIRNSENILNDTQIDERNLMLIETILSSRESKEIVLAWGHGKNKTYPNAIKSLMKKIGDGNFKQISHSLDSEHKMMHPDNRAWINKNSWGEAIGFNNYAEITHYPNIQ